LIENLSMIPSTSPARIFALRESAFACDLFITAISYFDFFNWLDKYPSDVDTICKSLGIKQRPADVMLTLFKAYGFIKEKNKKYYLSETSGDFLTGNSNYDLSPYINSLKNRPICQQMKKAMQTGKPANWAADKKGKDWATSMSEDSFAESFSAGMNSRGAYLADGVVRAIDLTGNQRLLDIGGASGIYSITFLSSFPDLAATVFEKPPVDKVAQYSINKFGLNKRINVVAGDMFHDSLPKGNDVHFLSHVLHDWDVNEVRVILKNSFDNLNPGGTIIIHDAHVNKSKTGPVSVAEYSVLLMFLSEGKCYSVTEMKNMLEEAGFNNVQYKPAVLNRSIIIAQK
jgi:predicted O-methyltransferase YrrM